MDLDDYRNIINLDANVFLKENTLTNQTNRDFLVNYILGYFYSHETNLVKLVKSKLKINENIHIPDMRFFLYALLTIRGAKPLPPNILSQIDQLLEVELIDRKILSISNIKTISRTIPGLRFPFGDKCAVWLGDITLLRVDAIVNAANETLLGCLDPNHPCVDNAIHARAGPQLRADCAKIIEKQGCSEKVGMAKITNAYNLPANYVIHTVGPKYILDSSPGDNTTNLLSEDLKSCYISCLNLASRIDNIRTIAFPFISAGSFGFPKSLAANIALKAVYSWLIKNPNRFDMIIFNVFDESDYSIFLTILKSFKIA